MLKRKKAWLLTQFSKAKKQQQGIFLTKYALLLPISAYMR